MENVFYNLGASLAYAIPVAIALFCILKIRKNRTEIKRLESKQKEEKR